MVEHLWQDGILPTSSSFPVFNEAVSFQEYSEQVTVKLLLLDRLDEIYEIQTSVPDNKWEMESHQRIGIFGVPFEERWSSLGIPLSIDGQQHPYDNGSSDESIARLGGTIILRRSTSNTQGLYSSLTDLLDLSFLGRHGGSRKLCVP